VHFDAHERRVEAGEAAAVHHGEGHGCTTDRRRFG
jgi:hypothetical protein